METRTVKVTIKQDGNNKALKELTLTVYSKQESTLSYESVKLQLLVFVYRDYNVCRYCVPQG